MLLVVCPNLALDRILQVEHFHANQVQRSRSVLVQPGGKGANVARVFRQLGGEVALVGFAGSSNGSSIVESLRDLGIHVDVIAAYDGSSRTCTIICDPQSVSHPTVINEESPQIEPDAAARLIKTVRRWLPRVEAVLATGSLTMGLPVDFYAQILDEARARGKFTAIDAAGAVLRVGLSSHPMFMKPNTDEFFELTHTLNNPGAFILPAHTTVTFGNVGAVLLHEGRCLHAKPPRLFDVNPIGAGDAFVATYLRYFLNRYTAADCLRLAVAAAASDAATLRPGFIEISQFQSLAGQVELRFL